MKRGRDREAPGLALLAAALALSAAAPGIAGAPVSPAGEAIARARAAIEKEPSDIDRRNELALALVRRAREAGDPGYFDQAAEALGECLRLSPGNFEAEKIGVRVLLGKGELRQALEAAKALNERMPDDVPTYALMAEACIELGRYEEAERAAQWCLDMRPGEVCGLTCAARLREVFGDIEGAVELWTSAFQRTMPAEVEDRAWLLTRLARLQRSAGKLEIAEKLLEEALRVFPKYHFAIAEVVRLRSSEKRHAEALSLCRELYREAPRPQYEFLLAEALARAGEPKEAGVRFAEFEAAALAASGLSRNANRELIDHLADPARKPAEALRIAELEISRRQDVQTLGAHAWALCAAGQPEKASRQMEKALAVGIRDPGFFYHAGAIAAKAGDATGARRHLRACLDLAPRSDWSDRAVEALAELEKRGAR